MQANKGAHEQWRAHHSDSACLVGGLLSAWRWDLAVCLLLGLACLLIYNANVRTIGAADTYPARYLPLSILKHHSLTLDPIAPLVAQGRELPTAPSKATTAFWMLKSPKGSLVSLYPVVTPVVVAPLYLPAVAYLDDKGWELTRVDYVARVMEKLCASLLAALTVMLLYLLLRRRSPPATAALLSLAFALGTTTWMISSQALWMHGLAGLLVVAQLYLLTGRCTPLRALAAGLFCALLACNRQPDAILAAGFALYAIHWAGRRFPWFLLAALMPVGLVLAYNLLVVGHIVGGYGLLSLKQETAKFGEDILGGLGVLLFSPVFGLFVFSPFLLFVPVFLASVLREKSSRALTLLLGAAVLLQWLFYGATHWEQGISWGPRYLTESIPILVWMLPPVIARLRMVGRIAFGLACLAAVAIQAVGAFYYTGKPLSAALNAAGPIAERSTWQKLVWDLDNTPFVTELEHGRIAPDLGELRGHIDVAGARDESDGRRLVIAGWALLDGRTPSDVALMVDGRTVLGGSVAFFARPDVANALGVSAPSGWRVSFPADLLTPGEHTVTALVRAHGDGQQRMLEARRFTVAKVDLDLLPLQGHIDLAGTLDANDALLRVIEGWALVGSYTPTEITVIVDGQVLGSTTTFFARPDVAAALIAPAPSGWRVTFAADALAPGEHEVSVQVRARPGGPQRVLETRRFTAAKSEPVLVTASRRAAATLIERQDRLGYWVSEFSKSTQFMLQGQELNLFTNAALIDVVAPVAPQSGLVDSLERARQFLSKQIEDDGLVRYHGRPELKTMGVLGCVITPDSDDTALAWRIAPSSRSELQAQALSTLKQFRRPDGLYQTWLAPRDRFRCIDPGKDPNPPDIGIQLHVYLWLAQVDRPAAAELCSALQKRESDESLWVYYRLAPPIVLLRLNEVSEAGCPLQLPPARLQTAVAGQEIWLELLDHLRHYEMANDLSADRAQAVEQLLGKLAADNFAAVKGNPPLLYHNDLSASVSRYYWSESFGYALWLRLYYENQRAHAGADEQGGAQP